jgi:hypothetical protein
VVRQTARRRLEKKLAADPSAILNPAEIRVLDRELQRLLVSSFPGLSANILARSADTIRWQTVGARCAQARGARGIRDVSGALGIPQYRLRAIEGGRLSEFRVDLARRYFHFLGIEPWVTAWCRANRELASRVGLLDPRPREPRTRQSRRGWSPSFQRTTS